MHAAYHDNGLRRHAVSESRALKRQRESLEAKRAALEQSLKEINANLEEVDNKKRRTRSQSLLKFEDSKNVVYTVPMDSVTVESRLMTAEAKKAIIANMRAAAGVVAPQPQPSPQQDEEAAGTISQQRVAYVEVSDAVVEPSSWLDCGGLGWCVASEGSDAHAQKAPPSQAAQRVPPRVDLLSRRGRRGFTKGFRVKVPGTARLRRG